MAFRIEPLIMAELDALEPEKIAVEGHFGGTKPQYHMQKAFNWLSGEVHHLESCFRMEDLHFGWKKNDEHHQES